MAPQLVETVIEALAVATHISDHYLGKGGELSSSGHAIHPGESAMRKGTAGTLRGPVRRSTTIRLIDTLTAFIYSLSAVAPANC
jgi:hypothetical protein